MARKKRATLKWGVSHEILQALFSAKEIRQILRKARGIIDGIAVFDEAAVSRATRRIRFSIFGKDFVLRYDAAEDYWVLTMPVPRRKLSDASGAATPAPEMKKEGGKAGRKRRSRKKLMKRLLYKLATAVDSSGIQPWLSAFRHRAELFARHTSTTTLVGVRSWNDFISYRIVRKVRNWAASQRMWGGQGATLRKLHVGGRRIVAFLYRPQEAVAGGGALRSSTLFGNRVEESERLTV